MDQRDSPERIDPMLAAEPTDSTAAMDPADPIERIDPAEPIDKIDPLDPMLRIEPDVLGPDCRGTVTMIALSQPGSGRRSEGAGSLGQSQDHGLFSARSRLSGDPGRVVVSAVSWCWRRLFSGLFSGAAGLAAGFRACWRPGCLRIVPGDRAAGCF